MSKLSHQERHMFEQPLQAKWQSQFNSDKNKFKYILYKIIHFVCTRQSLTTELIEAMESKLTNRQKERRLHTQFVHQLMGVPKLLINNKPLITNPAWKTLKHILHVLELKDHDKCTFEKINKPKSYKKQFIVVHTVSLKPANFFTGTTDVSSIPLVMGKHNEYKFACATCFHPHDVIRQQIEAAAENNRLSRFAQRVLPEAIQDISYFGHFTSITQCNNSLHVHQGYRDFFIIDEHNISFNTDVDDSIPLKFVWAIYVRDVGHA